MCRADLVVKSLRPVLGLVKFGGFLEFLAYLQRLGNEQDLYSNEYSKAVRPRPYC